MPSFRANRSCRDILGATEVEPLQWVLDWLVWTRYLEGVVPKGVAVRIRARAFPTSRHCSSGVELSIRNRAVVGSNPTSGSAFPAFCHRSESSNRLIPLSTSISRSVAPIAST